MTEKSIRWASCVWSSSTCSSHYHISFPVHPQKSPWLMWGLILHRGPHASPTPAPVPPLQFTQVLGLPFLSPSSSASSPLNFDILMCLYLKWHSIKQNIPPFTCEPHHLSHSSLHHSQAGYQRDVYTGALELFLITYSPLSLWDLASVLMA